jgi:glutamate-ammonia-ligase adenylyltransferase
MSLTNEIKQYLLQAWHEDTARNSLERWLEVSEKEHWENRPENLEILIKVFGASWYFTRYLFVCGSSSLALLEETALSLSDEQDFREFLEPAIKIEELEESLNKLRELKNGCMLYVLARYLRGELPIIQLEYLLTLLAEETLRVLIKILEKKAPSGSLPITILGMGRLAGYEMTFGSDLDLIFLYESEDQELSANIGRTIRMLMRTIAYPGEREIWERQMMTRSRPVLVMSKNWDEIMHDVNGHIYSGHDPAGVKQQIKEMRQRVEKELGSPKGKIDIKRGRGGIMDIDFITHFLQLTHGHENLELQTASTRSALAEAGYLGLLKDDVKVTLLSGYDYLKKSEMALRLFDLKSVDTFPLDESEITHLSRAMGHGDNAEDYVVTGITMPR